MNRNIKYNSTVSGLSAAGESMTPLVALSHVVPMVEAQKTQISRGADPIPRHK
jgi:hypothetical protein